MDFEDLEDTTLIDYSSLETGKKKKRKTPDFVRDYSKNPEPDILELQEGVKPRVSTFPGTIKYDPQKFPTDFTHRTQNNKFTYQRNMMNPHYAAIKANQYGGKCYVGYDVDGDGESDVIVTNDKGEIVWFNCHSVVKSDAVNIIKQYTANRNPSKTHKIPDFVTNKYTGNPVYESTRISIYANVMKLAGVVSKQLAPLVHGDVIVNIYGKALSHKDNEKTRRLLRMVYKDKNYNIVITSLAAKLLQGLVYKILDNGHKQPNNPYLELLEKTEIENKKGTKQLFVSAKNPVRLKWNRMLIHNIGGVKDTIIAYINNLSKDEKTTAQLCLYYSVYNYYNIDFERERKEEKIEEEKMKIETQTEKNKNIAEKNFIDICEEIIKKQVGLRNTVKTLFNQYVTKKVDRSKIAPRVKQEKKLKMR
jgi:hypothetical protein